MWQVPVSIRIIKNMIEEALLRVCTLGRDTKYFRVWMSLHHGSTLSPFLCTLVMDVLSGPIHGDVLWCMLFSDDIMLVDDLSARLARK